jgi:hypothetical protein
MSDYKFTESTKRTYLNDFQYFLENRTEFDYSVQELLMEDLFNMVNATDEYHCRQRIDLTEVDLEDEEELVKLLSAQIEYDLFFDDSITLIFNSKLVYQQAVPDADALIDASNLRRFNVPDGMYVFANYECEYEEM